MVKKSKEQQDERQDEGQFIELPEDRLEQIEKSTPQKDPVKKPRRKTSSQRKPKQAKVEDELPAKEPEKPVLSPDDLLADVRQELLAEEDEVEEPKGLFGRFRKKVKKAPETEQKKSDTQAELDALLESQEDLQKSVIESKQRKKAPSKNKEEEIAIQEFFADLEAMADIEPEEYEPPAPEPQVVFDVAEGEAEPVQTLKLPEKSKQEIDFDAVREMALEEYDQTKIEVEERKAPIKEEVRETIRELKPFERMMLIGAGILTVLVLLSSGIFLIVNSISAPSPTPTVPVDMADVIHPTRLTLPGGWEFSLGQGQVVEGEWSPKRAEWLAGTEISRWVALPWSLQLEAVLRTLKPEDQLELTMSNFDVLTFNVYSIRELTMEQLLASDPKIPGLVVVLYNNEEEDGTYWVVEGRP